MEEKEQNLLKPTFNLDDFFTTQEQRDEETKEKVEEIDISLIDNFPKHPFKVLENEDLEKLKNSIVEHGVLEPILVRPKENGRFEIISGHRRKRASELLGISTIKSIVKNLDDDTAIINMVDSNIHREKILPSEKAFAYKMKYEALKHQGKKSYLTSGPLDQKLSAEQIGTEHGESEKTVRRYIRLTHLIPELLEMVDNSELDKVPAISKRPAAELSYLKENEQKWLLNSIGYSDATPSLAQAIKLKKLSQTNKLTEDVMDDILIEQKANQIYKVRISEDKLRNYIPKNVKVDDMEGFVLKAVEYYSKHLKSRDRDSR